MANKLSIIRNATIAAILLLSSSNSLAAIYKCNISGETSYQSAPCETPSNTNTVITSILSKTKAVKRCENSFNHCLMKLNPSLYKEGKDYCMARLDLCTAKSGKKAHETVELYTAKVTFLAKVYSSRLSSLSAQERAKAHQNKLNSIDSNYNIGVKNGAEKYYKTCFKRLSSSIKNISGAPSSLKRACSNGMKASCNFGLRKIAKKRCGARRSNYLNRWLR